MIYPLPFLICALLQLGCAAVSAWWSQRRGDEVPLITSVFLLYVFSFRLFAILNGWASPVDISQFGFRPMDLNDAIVVLQIAVLGQGIFFVSYFAFQNRRVSHRAIFAQPAVIAWLRSRALLLATLGIPTALAARWLARAQAESGAVMAFESSAYLYLYPFMLISVAILVAIAWKAGGFASPGKRFVAAAILVCVAILTFGPTARFQFLGWIIACTIIFAYGASIARKVLTMFTGVLFAVILFAVAGAMRESEQVDFELQQSAWERFAFAADANMLDGFALLREVYPEVLPFEYGAGHLEIFERPIPRAWWPGKPVGGYLNELGLTSVQTGGTVGISPSLFGSFYQEGGISAVIIFSVIYGGGLGWLVKLSTRISVVGGVLIRAMLCAFLIPLLRGGDLPGVYAWGFMAFWPCLGLLWLKRRELLMSPPNKPRLQAPVLRSMAS